MGNPPLFTTTSNCVLVCLRVRLVVCILLLLNVVLNVGQPALSPSSNRWLPAGHGGFEALTSAQLGSGLYSYSTTTTTITSVRFPLDVHTCVSIPKLSSLFPSSSVCHTRARPCHHLGPCTRAPPPSCYLPSTSFFLPSLQRLFILFVLILVLRDHQWLKMTCSKRSDGGLYLK